METGDELMQRKSGRQVAGVVIGMLVAVALAATTAEGATPYAYEPIDLQKVPIPEGFSNPQGGSFTTDGDHVLVAAAGPGSTTANQIIITNVNTGATRCLTCQGGPTITIKGGVIPNLFPDGKRIFLGFFGVMECAPSVVDCKSYTYLPYDLTGTQGLGSIGVPAEAAGSTTAVGGLAPPGGAALQPSVGILGGTSPKLSPDGKHMAFSVIRSDTILLMVIGKLVRKDDKYVVEDPRVINPPAPTSTTDTSVERWSRSSALFELKTFSRNGAGLTYVQVGGEAGFNPDIWEVDLKTGVRRRLTSHPDWDEDNAPSPDGKYMELWSNRQTHLLDWSGGQMPYRDFIDAPAIAALADFTINNRNNLYCGGTAWLMPEAGDEGATLGGQPIITGDPNARVTDNVNGWSMWHPKSTAFTMLLTTAGDNGGVYAKTTPPYTMIARLSSRKPSEPLPLGDSTIGAWAPAPEDYHGPYASTGTTTLKGPGGGTVTVDRSGVGITVGRWTATYNDYSEDGKTFLNGSRTITKPNLTFAQPAYVVIDQADLTLTGEHTGSIKGDVTYQKDPRDPYVHAIGTMTSTYDGKAITGPSKWIQNKPGDCPEENVLKQPKLETKAKRIGDRRWRVAVTASVTGMGANQTATDTRPVRQATITGAGKNVRTKDDGTAIVTLPANRTGTTQLKVTAGNTLVPTTLTLPTPCTSRRSVTVNLRVVSRARVRSVTVYVNGKRVKTQRSSSKRVRLTLTGRAKGTSKIRFIITTSTGKKITDTRTYRTCTKR